MSEFFFTAHDSALKARFHAKYPFKRRSASQIKEQYMKALPQQPRN